MICTILPNLPNPDTTDTLEYVIKVAVVCIATALGYYFKRTVDSLAKKKPLGKLHLESHEIHRSLVRAVNSTIPYLQFNCPARTLLFRDILLLKYQQAITTFKSVNNVDFNTMSVTELNEWWVKFLDNYADSCRETLLKSKIPKVSYVYGLFCKSHAHEWAEARDKVARIAFQENVYVNNNAKVWSMLDVYVTVFNSALMDAVETFNNINGALNGVKYRGSVCDCGNCSNKEGN